MSRVLVIAEHDGRHLNPSTGRTVRCAQDLEPEALEVAVFAADGHALCEQASRLAGVTRVLSVENAANAHSLAAILAPQIAALADAYTHVLAPSTTFGKDVLPRAAALLGVGQVSDVMEVLGSHRFKRPIYAGNVILTVEAPAEQILLATVRTASYATAAESETRAPVEPVTLQVELPDHTRPGALEQSESERPDLQSATRVVAGGRALGSAENFDLVFRFAEVLGAAVGATRAAVDAGYVSNELQVGQTGKIIAPELYVAVGISGAIQHLTGIKDAGTIVAINQDGEAPIFDVADLGLVGDLFDVLPELQRRIEALKAH